MNRKENERTPTPPFFGNSYLLEIPIETVLHFLHENFLFRYHWKIKIGESFEAAKNRLKEMLFEAKEKNVFHLKAVYGYYYSVSDGDDLIVYTDREEESKAIRFHFPKKIQGKKKSIAHFFLSKEADEKDVVAFQIVMIGQQAIEYEKNKYQQGLYQDYFYWHGLSCAITEALAEYVHYRIRADLGFIKDEAKNPRERFKQKYRGARYSFGYPSCPNLEDQKKIIDLLEAEKIGVSLTEDFQLIPETSTTAIIVPNSL